MKKICEQKGIIYFFAERFNCSLLSMIGRITVTWYCTRDICIREGFRAENSRALNWRVTRR